MDKEEQLKEILKAQFDKMKKHAINYQNNPYLPRNVHQYRVHMRRLRGLLNFLKPIIDSELYKATNKLLREQGKKLSPIREIDVFSYKISDIAQEYPDLTDHYLKLFNFLAEERVRLINKKASVKAVKASKAMIDQLEEDLKNITFQLGETEYKSVDAFIDKRLDERLSELEKEYNKISAADYEHTHETRKLAKKVRYAADGFKDFLSNDQSKKITNRTKEIQEELGVVTDMHVNVELAEKYRNTVKNKKLKEAFDQLVTHLSERID
jgi:CHAD domain-containing protein